MNKFFSNIFDRIFVLIGALLFMQVPLFMQAYRHQLAGHVAELSYQIDALQRIAIESGKTLDQYISKFLVSSDPDFVLQGEWMKNMLHRFQDLSMGLLSLDTASVYKRPFIFFQHLHYDIASATFGAFNLGIPLTFEGLAYALLGMLTGYLVFKSFCLAFIKKNVHETT